MPPPVSPATALQVMTRNLDVLEPLITNASKQGAQVVVLPEDALYGFLNCKRQEIAPYLEQIPVANGSNPCTSDIAGTPVLTRLSCIAKKLGILLVADMGDRQPCSGNPGCPPDGQFQYNTQVVLDATGALIAKYWKTHLFYEGQYNTPPGGVDVVTFKSSLGIEFGLMICFDMMFSNPALNILSKGVRNFLVSSWWVNTPPSFTATQYWQAWARHFGANLIVAGGLQHPAYVYSGSGIYAPTETLKSLYNTGDVPSDHVLVATVDSEPKQPTAGEVAPRTPSKRFQPLRNISQGNSCQGTQEPVVQRAMAACDTTNGDPYVTFQAVAGTSGSKNVSCGYFTCAASYTVSAKQSTSAAVETYALVAFAGEYSNNAYYEEICMFYRCATHLDCLRAVLSASTAFDSIALTGTFRDATDIFGLAAGSNADVLPVAATAVDSTNGRVRTTQKAVVLNLVAFGLQMNRTTYGN
eukprot:TRINITY_DN14070_c0_g1_i1.p1 TRINITY_DN14070_c0_g1~~TRINITY_DN14070_c0_g1_i1.p1  ORF type:complete len:507 (-),score=42.73 TRINITY_DN14070_c0_g1_i1:44-1450(-)